MITRRDFIRGLGAAEAVSLGDQARLFTADDDGIMRVFLDGVDVSDCATECYASIHPDTPIYGWVEGFTDNVAPLITEVKWGEVYWQEVEPTHPDLKWLFGKPVVWTEDLF